MDHKTKRSEILVYRNAQAWQRCKTRKTMDYGNFIAGRTMDQKTVKKEVKSWSTEGECKETGAKHDKYGKQGKQWAIEM